MNDVNKRFEELMRDVELEAPSDAVSVSVLDDLELNRRFTMVKEELYGLGEMLNPTTQRGRDLHSERAAYLVELRRRRML